MKKRYIYYLISEAPLSARESSLKIQVTLVTHDSLATSWHTCPVRKASGASLTTEDSQKKISWMEESGICRKYIKVLCMEFSTLGFWKYHVFLDLASLASLFLGDITYVMSPLIMNFNHNNRYIAELLFGYIVISHLPLDWIFSDQSFRRSASSYLKHLAAGSSAQFNNCSRNEEGRQNSDRRYPFDNLDSDDNDQWYADNGRLIRDKHSTLPSCNPLAACPYTNRRIVHFIFLDRFQAVIAIRELLLFSSLRIL